MEINLFNFRHFILQAIVILQHEKFIHLFRQL